MQSSSDCVIVATFCYTDNGGAMTGKIYEPIMMRRPILLLVNGPGKNSEPGAFVKYLEAGTVYEESTNQENVDVIKHMLLLMKESKKTKGFLNSHINEEKRNKYNYADIAKQLVGIFTNDI